MTDRETRRFAGEDIYRILFGTKDGASIEGFPSARGCEPLVATAKQRREMPDAPRPVLSFWLTKAVIEAVKGEKVQDVGLSGDLVWVKANGRTLSLDRSDASRPVWYPVHFPAYLMGLIGLAEAVLFPEEAQDLLEAHHALQTWYAFTGRELQDNDETRRLLHRTSDELAWWLAFGGREHNRLMAAQVITGTDAGPQPDLSTARSRLAQTLSDPAAMAQLLGQAPLDSAKTGNVVSSQRSYEDLVLDGISLEGTSFRGKRVLAELANAVRAAQPVLLVGPTGTGKTTAVNDVVRLLDLPMIPIHGMNGLEDIDFLGSNQPAGDGGWAWVDGPLVKAWKQAGTEKVMVFVDELTAIPEQQRNIYKTAINPTPGALVPDDILADIVRSPADRYYLLKIREMDRMLACPVENLALVAACNIGTQYAVEPLDDALDSRFAIQANVGYLCEGEEVELVQSRSGLPPKVALALVKIAAETRRQYLNGELATPLDPRRLIVWAENIYTLTARAEYHTDRLVEIARETARVTWLTSVVGRDHRGEPNEARMAGLLDFAGLALGRSL